MNLNDRLWIQCKLQIVHPSLSSHIHARGVISLSHGTRPSRKVAMTTGTTRGRIFFMFTFSTIRIRCRLHPT